MPKNLPSGKGTACTGANNVIPGTVGILFNFRFSTASTADGLKSRLEDILKQHGIDYEIVWTLGARPFLTAEGSLVEATRGAIRDELGIETELSTTGSTSDGRFIAQICPQVIEFGPLNASIHKIDEWVEAASLEPLKNIYRRTLQTLLA